jgi:hypothetical protein
MKTVFTEAQQVHATNTLLNLMKNRRFFLSRKKTDDGTFEYELDENFAEVIDFDKYLRTLYAETQQEAENLIIEKEKALGIVAPTLKDGQSVVDCNLHTGGLEIVNVIPLTAFDKYISRKYDDQVTLDAFEAEVKAMQEWNKDGSRCVVVMRSRFVCRNSDANEDFMESKVLDIQNFPHVLGHVFNEHIEILGEGRHIPDWCLVFGTSRKSHVCIEYKFNDVKTLHFRKQGGYNYKVCFATVL